MNAIGVVTDHAVTAIAILAIVEAALAAHLLRRLEATKRRMAVAVDAAEVAARAAGLAAPGGIDPEVVVGLLRAGRPVTLDSVYAAMAANGAKDS